MFDYSIKPKCTGDKPDTNYIPPPSVGEYPTIQLPPFYEEDICASRKMNDIAKMGGSPCVKHKEADKLLCEILFAIGFGKTVEEFQKMEKWYA